MESAKQNLGLLKGFVFRLEAWQILLILGSGVITSLYLTTLFLIPFLLSGPPILYAIMSLLTLLVLNRMTTISKYGVRFSFFIFFGIVLVLGPGIALLLLLLTTPVLFFIATRETPIDFMLKKNLKNILKRTLNYIVLIFIFTFTFWFYGMGFVMQNLADVFLKLYIVWTIFLFAKRYFLGKRLFGWRASTVFISAYLNYWLLQNFGMQYINYLMGL